MYEPINVIDVSYVRKVNAKPKSKPYFRGIITVSKNMIYSLKKT